jgi:hypothetical protein
MAGFVALHQAGIFPTTDEIITSDDVKQTEGAMDRLGLVDLNTPETRAFCESIARQALAMFASPVRRKMVTKLARKLMRHRTIKGKKVERILRRMERRHGLFMGVPLS